MNSNLLSYASDTNHYTISIVAEEKFDLFVDSIISFEEKIERDNPRIRAILLLKDLENLNKNISWIDSKIEVYIVDSLDNFIIRTFEILSIDEYYTDSKEVYFRLILQDEISYKLDNMFISKSFSISRTLAFKSIIEKYETQSILDSNKIKFIYTDDDVNDQFVIPSTISVLEFFCQEFRRLGYSLYQNRNGLCISKKSDLLPSKLAEVEHPFLQLVENQLYKNKVHDIINVPLNKEEINKTPVTKMYVFDHDNKRMVLYNNNDQLDSTLLNSKNKNLKNTIGSKAIYGTKLSDANFNSIITDSFLKKAKTIIFVAGLINRNINEIITLELAGNKGSTESSNEGNVQNSGKYLVISVTEKMVGGKLIQKLELVRSDEN